MKRMKKVLAGLLAATMVMSMSVTAWAEELNMTSPEGSCDAYIKAYTLEGTTDKTLYPAETLNFTSTPAENNPDTTNLVIAPLQVVGNSDQKLAITIPSYTKAGIYKYTIAETAGETQGVSYTNGTIEVSVLVEYDYDDADNDGYGLKATVGVTSSGGSKSGTFTNTYKLGSLKVSKEVSGNMASKTQKFDIDVTFTSDQEVLSEISYGGDKTIAINNWTKGEDSDVWTVTKTISIAHGEDVTFSNIPEEVTYSVAEQDKHFALDATGSDPATGYSVKYTDADENKTIAVNETDEVTVTNTKGTNVDTGIILDSAPYILLLAFAAMGVFAVVSKKREEEF